MSHTIKLLVLVAFAACTVREAAAAPVQSHTPSGARSINQLVGVKAFSPSSSASPASSSPSARIPAKSPATVASHPVAKTNGGVNVVVAKPAPIVRNPAPITVKPAPVAVKPAPVAVKPNFNLKPLNAKPNPILVPRSTSEITKTPALPVQKSGIIGKIKLPVKTPLRVVQPNGPAPNWSSAMGRYHWTKSPNSWYIRTNKAILISANYPHFSQKCFSRRLNCHCYFDASTFAWYGWSATHGCYLPCSYLVEHCKSTPVSPASCSNCNAAATPADVGTDSPTVDQAENTEMIPDNAAPTNTTPTADDQTAEDEAPADFDPATSDSTSETPVDPTMAVGGVEGLPTGQLTLDGLPSAADPSLRK